MSGTLRGEQDSTPQPTLNTRPQTIPMNCAGGRSSNTPGTLVTRLVARAFIAQPRIDTALRTLQTRIDDSHVDRACGEGWPRTCGLPRPRW